MTLNITKKISDCRMTVGVSGMLDLDSSYKLEDVLTEDISEIREIILDFKGLNYISSAGLRVVMEIHRRMKKQQGKLVIKNANSFVMDVFETTNLIEILNIQ